MREEVIFVHPVTESVWITNFAWDDLLRPSRLTDREYLESCMQRLADQEGFTTIPEYRIAPEGESAGADWYFRNAWIDVDFKVDMAKAREIHMFNIRNARNAELADLDVPFMQAVEANDRDELARISSLKQTLRDIPQTIDLFTGISTPANLKAKWPVGLRRNSD